MRRADEDIEHDVRFRSLNAADGRAELVHVQWKELLADDFAAKRLGGLPDPLGGDLPVVVVGRQDVDSLAPAVSCCPQQQVDVDARRCARGEEVAVADPALVVRVVDVEGVKPMQDGPDDLARRARQSALDHCNPIPEGQLVGELVVELHVGLGVVELDLELPAEQAARFVDLIDRQLGATPLVVAETLEGARQVIDGTNRDRIVGLGLAPKHGNGSGGGGSFDERASCQQRDEFSRAIWRCTPWRSTVG